MSIKCGRERLYFRCASTLIKRGLRMRKLYRPYLPREVAARGLLEVSLHRRLRKTPTDSSSGPSEEGCREQQLRQVFIIVIIKYR